MGTRSFIATETNNEYISAYCHWDGYPEGVGKHLKEGISSPEEALSLIKGGDMRSYDGHAEYFNDAHSKPLQHTSYDDLVRSARNSGAEYLYIFNTDTNKWTHLQP